MKKRIIAICLCLCLVVCFAFKFYNKSYADPFTASQIGAASYAIMNGWGISFFATSATGQGVTDFMADQVEDYVNQQGGTIADVFVGQMAINTAGKLVVAYDLYNSIIGFKDYLVSKFGLNDQFIDINAGHVGGISWSFYNPRGAGYADRLIYAEGSVEGSEHTVAPSGYCWAGTVTSIEKDGKNVRVRTPLLYKDGEMYNPTASTVFTYKTAVPIEDKLAWNGLNYVAPTVIDPSQEWIGTIQNVPDTNLDQLLEGVGVNVADNNLSVEGDVIDIPVPTPTPMPIDPDTPLSDVPWEGLDTNLSDLYNQGLEEIGAIGDAQDAITDAVSEQTGVLEGAIADNAGIVSGAIDQAVSDVEGAITSHAGVVSGAIDQAVSDIQDAISEQTQTLSESASATAEATETIAEALEDETINWQKFNLRGLFPFCIPFDIYNMLEALDASPTAPHVQLPFVIESIGFSYTIDLDFSAFDQVASVMRTMELIVYGIALAWATSKVIKW